MAKGNIIASTYSTNLAIELIGTGEQSGTWGTTTNTNLGTLLEQAISGVVTQSITDGADTTITIPNGASGVARNMYIEMTGALTATRNLIVPANKKLYFIFNNTTGGFAVTVKVTGQIGVSVPSLAKMILVMNSAGTDIVSAVSYFAALSAGSATLTTPLAVTSGGTGSATVTANNVIIGNSGGTGFSSVAPVTNGNVLTVAGGVWTSAAAAGAVSSFSAGTTGFTPSTGTTGAVTLAGTLIAANGGTGLTSPGTSGNVLTSNGSAWTSSSGSRVTLATAQASTSGTSIDFTSIPAGVKRITVMFTGVSTDTSGAGGAVKIIQIGDSGGFETTGYSSSASTGSSSNSAYTNGFLLEPVSVASATLDGAISFFLASSGNYSWVASGVLGSSDSGTRMSGGSKSLSAELDRIRITTGGGTATFDAGEINIQYEI